MGDSLYNWCIERQEKHPELKFECVTLKDPDDTTGHQDILQELLSKEVIDMDTDELKKEIAQKRRLVLDLKNLVNTKKYLTNERQLQELKKIEKSVYREMIGIAILLVFAIFSAILLIYYFFVFRRK